MAGSSLELPPDVAHGLVVRAFVAEAAADLGLDQGEVADLQLAATELLASAVEAGSVRFTIAFGPAGGGWSLTATGIGDLRTMPTDLPFLRLDLLSGLFADLEIDGSTARLGAERSSRL